MLRPTSLFARDCRKHCKHCLPDIECPISSGAAKASRTFVFQPGYGALTITNFDQAGGTFDSSEHDQLDFNGFSGNPNVHSDGNGNTIVDFGNGDVVTSSTAAVTLAIANNPGGATLSGALSVNAVNGVATFSTLKLNAAGAGYTLGATSGGLLATTSGAFNVT